MQVEYDLVVDFARPSKSNTIIISEGDTNSRLCHFTLLTNKSPMDMSMVTVATVMGVKEDGSVIYDDATIVTDDDDNMLNEVEYTVPAAITDTSGTVTMTIRLLGSDQTQITSFEFYLKVRNALYNEDDLVSESDLTGFRDLLNRALTAIQKIEAMTENTALPNPYPLNLTIEGDLTAYTGSEEMNVTLENIAYIAETVEELADSIDETAAASAAASAEAAATSAYNAGLSATAADDSADLAEGYKTTAVDAKEDAVSAKGLAEGYANQCATLINKLNLPTTAGTYHLVVTVVDGVITYSWEVDA